MFGPAEAFTPEQYAAAIRRQRPRHPARQPGRTAAHARAKQGCLSGCPAAARLAAHRLISSPYFAAKAAMDALAVLYARELARWGIETSIVVPGAFTKGTNHFAHSGSPGRRGALGRI